MPSQDVARPVADFLLCAIYGLPLAIVIYGRHAGLSHREFVRTKLFGEGPRRPQRAKNFRGFLLNAWTMVGFLANGATRHSDI